ncbi:MAG: hypothetical protein PHF33_10970 [Candidatus Delongbacteria bacterium]|nr:hypothetical protein [Candidatus Delongbacteria bacterium]
MSKSDALSAIGEAIAGGSRAIGKADNQDVVSSISGGDMITTIIIVAILFFFGACLWYGAKSLIRDIFKK